MLLPYQPDYKQDQLKVPGTGVCAAGACNGQHSHQVTPLMVINNSHQRVSSCLMKNSAFQLNANETRTKTKHSRASVRRECMIRSMYHYFMCTARNKFRFIFTVSPLFLSSTFHYLLTQFQLQRLPTDCLRRSPSFRKSRFPEPTTSQMTKAWHACSSTSTHTPAFGCDIVANESAVRRATYRLPVNYVKCRSFHVTARKCHPIQQPEWVYLVDEEKKAIVKNFSFSFIDLTMKMFSLAYFPFLLHRLRFQVTIRCCGKRAKQIFMNAKKRKFFEVHKRLHKFAMKRPGE